MMNPESKNVFKPVLQFEEKDVYGRALFYPKNELAKILVSITPKITMDKAQLDKLKNKFEIELVKNYTFQEFKK